MKAMVFMLMVVAGWAGLVGTEWLATEGVKRVANSLPPTYEMAEGLMKAGLVASQMVKE